VIRWTKSRGTGTEEEIRTRGNGGIGYISSKSSFGTSPISHTCQLTYALTSSAILRCPFADNYRQPYLTTLLQEKREARGEERVHRRRDIEGKK
jgi:hypothetical protein